MHRFIIPQLLLSQSEQNHHSLLETQNMKSDTCVALAQLLIDRGTWGKAYKFQVCDL